MRTTLKPIEPTNHPHLSGLFAPVDEEIDAPDLPVLRGRIPEDLNGVYLRNGPNPKFPPLGSYTYPLDGDGMVHGVWLADGKARYRNRYVLTKGLKAEIRAGRALWGGLMTPTTPPPERAGADQDPEGEKVLPGISVICHAHHLLALGEGVAPYELTGGLDTIGRYDFAGGLPLGMCAHPKVDPKSGEMIVFRYGLDEPYLYWAAIGADGRVTHPPEVIAEVDRGYMIHDCMITEDYLVLVINPATFDLSRTARGASPLAWEPDRGTRIGVIPRRGQGGSIRWIETGAFWCWHYANAWQEGTEIVTCFPWWSHLAFGVPGVPAPTGRLVRARIDPLAGTFRTEVLDGRPTEFPRIDDRRTGQRTRYVTVAHRAAASLCTGAFDELFRLDLERGTMAVHRFEGCAIGEAVFAPKIGRSEEDAGYLLSFVTNVETMESRFIILDTEDFSGDATAEIGLPRRVPLGIHGNWLPAMGSNA